MAKRTPTFAIKKKGGKLRLKAPELYRSFVEGLPEGEDLWMKLSRSSPQKTNEQLGYYHAEVVPSAAEGLKEETGQDIEDQEADGILSRIFLTRNPGQVTEYVESKANLSKDQMREYISKCTHLCAKRWHIICRTSEEWKARWWID